MSLRGRGRGAAVCRGRGREGQERRSQPGYIVGLFQKLQNAWTADEALQVGPNASGDTAAHIAHCVAKFPPPHPEGVGSLLQACFADQHLSIKGLSKALWAASRLKPDLCGGEVKRSLWIAVQRLANELDSAGVAIALHAFAVLREPPPVGLLDALRATPPSQPQDVANCLWAIAKLRLDNKEEVQALVEIAGSVNMRPMELSMSLWALGSLGYEGSVENLTKQVPGALQGLNSQGISNTLWGLSKLECKLSKAVLSALETRAIAVLSEASSQAVANTATGLAKRSDCGGASIRYIKALVDVKGLRDLHAKDLASLAWCLASCSSVDTDIVKSLWCALGSIVQEVDWQDAGHFEFLARVHGCCSDELCMAIANRAAEAISSMNTVSRQTETHVLELARKAAQDKVSKEWRGLIVGDSTGHVHQSLLALGYTVECWSRFSGCATKGRSKPKSSTGCFDYCVVRIPTTKAALAHAIHLVRPLCNTDCLFLFAGRREEGIFSLKSSFTLREESTLSESQDAAVLCAIDPIPKEGLAIGATLVTLELDKSMEWITYPGLFAGGKIDIMTSRLLSVLPTIAEDARVLDFCCGSGVIAATVRQRCPSADLHALDADAVAIRAARKNLLGSQCWLSDGWTALEEAGAEVFNLILSNPPVHAGLMNDLSFLQRFLHGAADWLAPGGCVIFVVQSYIPIASLLRDTQLREPKVLYSDGRFIVWRCRGRAKRKRSSGT